MELCRNGRWGTVCDDLWDNTDAGVVCRQLGLGTGEFDWVCLVSYLLICTSAGLARGSAFFGQGNGSILMDNVGCVGTEQYLTNCTHITNHNCGHYEDAGVTCYTPPG